LPRPILNIVTKEVKEMMRDPRILLGMVLAPLIIFPLMGFALRTSTEAMQESLRTVPIAVADFDHGPVAQNLTTFLKSMPNVKVEVIEAQNPEEAATIAQASNVTSVVMIPEGFSNNITAGEKAQLKVYSVFRSGGIGESLTLSTAQSLVELFGRNLINATVTPKFPNNPNVLSPLVISQESIIKGKPEAVNPSALYSFTQAQSLGLPLALFMLIILAMQLASTSVATEKEEKTLETLMSLPLNRFTLLIGKLAGSTLVAAIGAVATILGVIYYMGSFTFGSLTQTSIDLAAIGLAPSILSYIVLGVSVFVALLSALALAVVISVFAEDVRGAQSLLGFVYMPLLIPMFALMFTDLNTLPFGFQILLLALPFTHPMLAARATITGDLLLPVLGIAYVAIFTLVILYIAARLFATEKILTAKIRLGRKKTKEE
jgi:ABC-2 type transport system permease protein